MISEALAACSSSIGINWHPLRVSAAISGTKVMPIPAARAIRTRIAQRRAPNALCRSNFQGRYHPLSFAPRLFTCVATSGAAQFTCFLIHRKYKNPFQEARRKAASEVAPQRKLAGSRGRWIVYSPAKERENLGSIQAVARYQYLSGRSGGPSANPAHGSSILIEKRISVKISSNRDSPT